MEKELVLVFRRDLLESLGAFQGIKLNPDFYLGHILDARNTRFLHRSQAEQDPDFKQIIPYVLMRRGDKFLYYVRGRKSGEKRLVAKGSLGIGGHINPDDESLFATGRDFYEAAVQRELHEELQVDGILENKIVALLNDDSTPVGRVHFGIVHLCQLNEGQVSKREACITELKFLTIEELKGYRGNLESWSQFCLDQLSSLLKVGC